MKNRKQNAVKKKSQITIQLENQKINGRAGIFSLVAGLVPAVLFYLGISLSFIGMLDLPVQVYYSAVFGLLILVILQIQGKYRRYVHAGTAILAVVLILLIIVRQELMLNGFLLTMNKVAEAAGRNFGIFLKVYDIGIPKELYIISYSMFWLLICLLTGAVVTFIVRMRSIILLCISVLPMLLLELCTGGDYGLLPAILMLGVLVVLSWFFVHGRKKRQSFGNGKYVAVLQVSGIMIVTFGVLLAVIITMIPVNGYTKAGFAQAVKEGIGKTISNIRYEKEKTNSFTQGQFTGLGNLTLKDETALEVLMDKPESLYLRGFVGSSYTEKGWKELDKAVYYKAKDLFYWLHETNFNGLNQLSLVNQLENGNTGNETVDITIQNVNANSKYLYTPYELKEDPGTIEGSHSLGDVSLKAEGVFGNRLYHYTSNSNLVKHYPKLAAGFYEIRDSNMAEEYAGNESYYNTFIYDHYLDIPDQQKQLLKNLLKKEPVEGNTHYPYEEANALIMGYLDKNMEYSEEVDTFSGQFDFLQWFLQSVKKGYSTHYATAAALMYRYLGIPARYVEGYLVTPNDVKGVDAYEPIEITGENAHAWVEVYQDGIGWVPMETTPPYLGIMERPEFSQAPALTGDGGQSDNAGKSEKIKDEEKELKKKKTGKKAEVPVKKIILTVIIILIVLAVLIWLIYFIYHRRKIARLKKNFLIPDYSLAVQHIYAYILFLYRADQLPAPQGSHYDYADILAEKYSAESAEKFRQTLDVVQGAVYGDLEVTAEQRDMILRFEEETLRNILKKKNLLVKFKMKFIDFIY
ncbi:DUF3488 and transglutaminase-like domain-containing protein [uncultured Robinsoniella sp.]|uniref:DUF3488 and transglutaminase-like domain-containing protein n=1 Tax=uncultured Robinsoniella sp. TaxID=904190 RepID=UPI00374F363A